MFRMQSFIRGAGAAVLIMAAVSGRAAAQRGSLTATLAGHRTTPASDTVALRIDAQMTPGWHIGAARPGATGVPTELTWRLPAGWRILTSRWPAPTPVLIGRDTAFEYHDPFAIETTLVTDGPHRSGPVQVVVTYGICRDVCIPGRLTLTYEVR
jgi:DsbC/DsbD-like thiol-disulfide interchange protein